jgi:hypothetical protein
VLHFVFEFKKRQVIRNWKTFLVVPDEVS